ncbi:hypothetical protein BYT27DRAFT_7100204 [Phlegmacium glaucopus]|nr:hypothetical protein BYT27DRAFT_7100204 [Phlegmacium glaucopus]
MVYLSAPLQLLVCTVTKIQAKLPLLTYPQWKRISFSRLTLCYFLFSLAHFIIQLSFQIKAFTINAEAARFLTRIVTEAQTTNHSLPFLGGSTLRMCSWVPSNLDVDIPSCVIVWDGDQTALNSSSGGYSPDDTKSSSTATPTFATLSVSTSLSATFTAATTSATTSATVSGSRTVTPSGLAQPTNVINDSFDTPLNNGKSGGNSHNDLHSRDIQIIPDLTPGQISVTLIGIKGNDSVTLDNSCLWSLNWPVSVLANTKREDLVFVAFQFWVLGMSIVALLNESIPHIIASLVTHLAATAWAAFQVARTTNFHSDFDRVITNGACKGASLLPEYWQARNQAEIPSLTLNVIGLFVSCFLTCKLIKLFGWQTFKRIGASLTISRIYKLVLTLSITIQLSLFFMAVTVSLWIDQLMNSIIGDLAKFQTLYKISSFITLALLIPWLMTGWFAVRRELRIPMMIFLMLSILYLGGWGVMFLSTTFRWTFTTWSFFAIMATASVVLTLLSAILGVVCRLNFGKGLARYLNAQQGLDGDSNYSTDNADIEKAAFPPFGQPVPTYVGDAKPTYPQQFSPYGPQGIATSPEHWVTFPEAALQRNVSFGSTRSLDTSYSSCQDNSSHSRNGSQTSHTSQTKRWVIE